VTDFAIIKLYLDEHIWSRLPQTLAQRGYDAVHACALGHIAWEDGDHLAYAAGQSRALLTFNIADFELLASEWFFAGREHAGIILSDQVPISELLRRIERLLQRVSAKEMHNSLRYLQSYKS
jgi:predicted nuclease of predicted toxin-antitoxin system